MERNKRMEEKRKLLEKLKLAVWMDDRRRDVRTDVIRDMEEDIGKAVPAMAAEEALERVDRYYRKAIQKYSVEIYESADEIGRRKMEALERDGVDRLKMSMESERQYYLREMEIYEQERDSLAQEMRGKAAEWMREEGLAQTPPMTVQELVGLTNRYYKQALKERALGIFGELRKVGDVEEIKMGEDKIDLPEDMETRAIPYRLWKYCEEAIHLYRAWRRGDKI